MDDDSFQFTEVTIQPPPPLTREEWEDLDRWNKEMHRIAVRTSGEPSEYPPNSWDEHWAAGRPGRSYFTKR